MMCTPNDESCLRTKARERLVGKGKSAVVLGHELYHGWSYEFTNETKGMNFGQRLTRETSAVKFENYLRASFGETIMRTNYLLQGNDMKVASSSVEEAKKYHLPTANYLKLEPVYKHLRQLPHDVDATHVKPPVGIVKTIDTRTQKL